MRVTGAATLGAPVETVWTVLRDRDLLVRAIPGCERLDVTGAGSCQLTITTAIAAVSGTYAGEAVITGRAEPSRLVARVSAAGGRGTVRADITVRLAPAGDSATELGYDVDAQVDGEIAGIGQRMLASIVKRLAGEFLAALDGSLGDSVGASGGASGRSVGGSVGAPAAGGRPEPAADLDRSRAGTGPAAGTGPGAGSGVRAGLLAGGAVGLAGILIGAVLGRRNRASARRSH